MDDSHATTNVYAQSEMVNGLNDDDALAELLALTDDDDDDGSGGALGGSASGARPPSFYSDKNTGKTPVSSPCSVAVEFPARQQTRGTDANAATDARRRRNRESMARTRLEKRERVDALTHQETALQRILQQVLAHNKPIHPVALPRTTMQRYQVEYTELVRQREVLRVENNALATTLVAQSQRARAVQNMLDHSVATATVGVSSGQLVEATPLPPSDAAGRWLHFHDSEPPLYYTNLTSAECESAIHDGLDVMEIIRRELTYPPASSTVLTAHCLGWKTERSREVCPSTGRLYVQMRCTKRIPRSRATLQELQDDTWQFLKSPALVSKVHDASVTAKIAQHVNEDAFVLLRNSADATNHRRFWYFSLNARLWSEDGTTAMVLMPVLKKQAQYHATAAAKGPQSIQWITHGIWCLRASHVSSEENGGADLTEIEYTGAIECLTEAHATHLLVANCSALLKWEQLVVPQQLLMH